MLAVVLRALAVCMVRALSSFLAPFWPPMPQLYYPKEPAHLIVRSPRKLEEPLDEDGIEEVTIKSFVESSCPSLFKPYRPTWWLPNGHFQTAFCVVGDFSGVDPVVYQRTLLRLQDGGTLGLDFTPPSAEVDLDPMTPIIVVLHGLTGGSNAEYVRAILGTACLSKEKGGLGYRAVVVNSRGCAGVPITSSQFYSPGHTDDLRCALLYISDVYPDAPLLGVGFSLGASVLANYLGQEGEKSRLRGGCLLACPWDLKKNSERLENNFFYRHTYSKALGNNLFRLLERHLPALNKMPPSVLTPHIPLILSIKSTPALITMDEHFVRLVGGSPPMFPFPCAHDYYRWASSHQRLSGVRVPVLALNSKDDPVVWALPTDEIVGSSHVVLGVTQHGGHLGWFEDGGAFLGRGKRPPRRWMTKPVVEWLGALGEKLVVANSGNDSRETKVSARRGVMKENGFVVDPDEGMRNRVGYRILDKGEGVEILEAEEVENVGLKGF
ncbi:hypothetical protein BOTBODRAFT_25808 [Botryobasidium botryosum FD-172 SS1]|uniref:AB hydrolase-1 domain-containing protein n=1 Tax=Botryobasidium botryosum (strain FD-172 SS1) TaxID=930990 RepID=A0A067NC93_BOTB1|nr:hypothetical protein BOTBODRAFT_25808 [Botryobasidium botryosum FD-172 SS1]